MAPASENLPHGAPASFLVLGLGNPGPEYAGNRHNVGFMALDLLARRLGGVRWRPQWHGEAAAVRIGDAAGWLLKPATFMNRSGAAAAAAMEAIAVPLTRVCVLHDDLDLACGRLKVSFDRGHGGHNGVRSIIDRLGGRAFGRIRIGIGRPAPGVTVVDHVLGDFTAEERDRIDEILPLAAEAVVTLLEQGPLAAMNQYNEVRERGGRHT